MTVDEFMQDLDQFGQQLSQPEQLLTNIGMQLQDAMRAQAPVDTGALKNSIRYQVEGNSLLFTMLLYGPFQNYGVNGTEDFTARQVQFGVQPRPTSEPFYAFKKRRFGLRPQPFFDMTNITNVIADQFADETINDF